MKVYLVEDCEFNPGRVYAVMASLEDAEAFAEALYNAEGIDTGVFERTLIYGQPNHLGYNE